MAVNVDRLLVLDPLQHGVDDDEAARPAYARTGVKKKKKKDTKLLCVLALNIFSVIHCAIIMFYIQQVL